MRWDFERSVWPGFAIPAVVSGTLLATGAWWVLGSVSATVFVLGACATTAIGGMLITSRHLRDASAQLRHPELRGPRSRGTGVYHPILEETLDRIGRLEDDARTACEQRTAAEARFRVRAKESRLTESACAALDEPVFATDAAGQIRFANEAARRLLAADAAGTADAAGAASLSLEGHPVLRQLVEDTLHRRQVSDRRSVEVECLAAGESSVHRATARAVDGEDGRPLGCAVVLRDVRDERRERTRHAEFVSSVCHELKTPLASIRAFAEMLRDDEVDDADERREICGFVEDQVDRLVRLVDNMLNLSRIESGVVEVRRKDCELNEILARSLDVVRPAAEAKSIRLVSELSELYLAVHTDPDLLSQAVINLLSNAVKYTPQGGEVRLRSRLEDQEAVVEVRDDGMGIPPESLPRLFERFYRVPQNCSAAAGTGLGLSLVKSIVVDLHNGRIDVKSEVGKGTCFGVHLPAGHRDRTRRRAEPVVAGGRA